MIGIITDSTCDIPQELIDRYGIVVIPQLVIWGDQQYRDRIDMSPQEFYERLPKEPVHPHSSLPSLQDFKDAYDKAVAQGADQLVVLTISSAMSGTFQLADSAARLSPIPISVIDSKGPTMTLGWQVLEAARARDEGADMVTITQRVAKVRSLLQQFVAMDSLEYLQHGGRIGDAAKWASTMLHVKPLICINHETGRVQPVSLFRTQKSLVEGMINKFFERLQGSKNLHIAVLHGNALERAQEVARRIQEEFHPVELLINITGPVLGLNTGPNALALAGYYEE